MNSVTRVLVRRSWLATLLLGVALLPAGAALADTSVVKFQEGDVFVAAGGFGTGEQSGIVQWRRSDGTFQKTLNTLPANFTTGMAFDSSGNLYVTGFDWDNVSVLDNTGALQGAFGSGYNCDPESIVFDSAGNAYVGQAGCSDDVLKFDSTGHLLAEFDVAIERVGSDWIDLADDDCTLYYTSEGTSVKRFDVCANRQLSDFAPPGTLQPQAYALRLLSAKWGGGLLAASSPSIARLDNRGNVVQTYDAGEDCWFALTLDPDGTSFWSADLCTSNVYKFDIGTGSVLLSFNTGTPHGSIHGLAVFGIQPQPVMCKGEPATQVGTRGDDLIIGTERRDVIAALAGDDTVFALGGDDRICADGGNDIVVGEDGNDTVFGGRGHDLLRGGRGDDHLEGAADNDTLFGGDGNDPWLDGGEAGCCDRPPNTGDDRVFGGPGDDVLWTADFGQVLALGGTGNDQLHGGCGADDLEGGGNDDTITGDESPPGFCESQGLEEGNDYIDGGERECCNRAANTGNDTLVGGRADDEISAADFGRATADGREGDDTLRGRRGPDTLTGGPGSDLVLGGPNDDTLHLTDGVNGNDSGDGQAGFDTCDADPGDNLDNCEA